MTEPGQIIEQTTQTSPQGPVDPNVTTVLEGSDDTVAPSPELIAQGAAGDHGDLEVTPQGLDSAAGQTHSVELNDTVGQSDLT